MHVDFQIRGVPADSHLRELVVSGLNDLGKLIPIIHADVVLEMQSDSTPAWQAVVSLKVPGPAIRAAARDHTWEGAWLKITARLRHEMESRSGSLPKAGAH